MNDQSSKTGPHDVNRLISDARKLPGWLGIKLFDAAISEAKEMKNVLERASALLELAKQLPVELFDRLIIPAHELPDDLYRTLIFMKIAERSPQEKQVPAYAMALTEIDGSKDPNLRSIQRDKVLQQVSTPRFEEIMKFVREHPEISTGAKVFTSSADRLQGDQRSSIYSELLEDISSLPNEEQRAEAFSHVVPHLPFAQLETAQRISRNFCDISRQGSTMLLVILRLHDLMSEESYRGTLLEFLAVLKNIDDSAIVSKLLKPACTAIPRDLVGEALMLLKDIDNEEVRYDLFVDLSQKMQSEQFGNFRSAIEWFSEAQYHALALSRIIQYAPITIKSEILQEILDQTEQVQNKFQTASLLLEISKDLAGDESLALLQVTLQMVRAIRDKEQRLALLWRLPRNMLNSDETAAVQKVQEENIRSCADKMYVEGGIGAADDIIISPRFSGDSTTGAPPPGKKQKPQGK